ncbi:hypothetical protein [Streptomyces sediminimaris]|uniref:hypothetical protein n=1 Tax=Streptomyces sediminimaris TaxID=3383721 RepID=UPI00399ABF97
MDLKPLARTAIAVVVAGTALVTAVGPAAVAAPRTAVVREGAPGPGGTAPAGGGTGNSLVDFGGAAIDFVGRLIGTGGGSV